MDRAVETVPAVEFPPVAGALPARRADLASPLSTTAVDAYDASPGLQATRLLATACEIESALAEVVRSSMPRFGSWCIIDLCEAGHIRRVAIVCSDAAEQTLADQLREGWLPQGDDAFGVPIAVRDERGVKAAAFTDDLLTRTARTSVNLELLRALRAGAFMTVPLAARGHILGAFTFVQRAGHGLPSSEEQLLAEDLGLRCAIVIDNARLIQDALDARAEAEEANVAKLRFLSTMSHELRTPLNGIAGYADILEAGLRGTLTDGQLADVRRIQANQRHLLGLVDSVLGYARVGATRMEFGHEDVSIAGVLADVQRVIMPLAEARGITCLGCRPEHGNDIVVHADRAKLEQIIVNLAANAIKFSRDGGSIAIDCRRVGGRVQIRVTDDGIGIAPEHLTKIFEPFVQLDDSATRRSGGTGLGLTLSQELANRMGGLITVESTLGKGSTFTLTLSRGRG